MSKARVAAFDILRRVESEGAYAGVLVAGLPQSKLSREDRALAQEITLGVLRHQKSLDYFIERYSRRTMERLDLPVLIALRMGLYQLRHLTRIPQSAAVNESVNLVKLARAASASGMVNAVLRQAARRMEERAGEAISDPAERAAVELSHPRWMLERWAAQLGPQQARALAAANNEPPRLAFRVNTIRASADEVIESLNAEGAAVQPSIMVAGAFVAEGAAGPVLRAAEQGSVYIQDEASQLVSLLVDAKHGHRILDLCAAPGSKSSHLAALTSGNAWIMACDIHHHRLLTLSATCRRLGITSIAPVAVDATRELPIVESAARFDRVLIDAPCSGTGTLMRNPEIKWRLAPDRIARLAELQLSLLERATDLVAERGRMVYSTCSVEPEENEAVIARFIESGAPFRAVQPAAAAALITAEGFVRTFPHAHKMDGFFAAVLEKTG